MTVNIPTQCIKFSLDIFARREPIEKIMTEKQL